MNQALNAYYTITASSEFREKERLYEKARHDEAQALRNAERRGEAKGKAEIAKKLLQMNLAIDQIMMATGLTREEMEVLKDVR